MHTSKNEMVKRPARIQRRDFLAAAGAALTAPYVVPSGVLAGPGRPGANDRLTVAHIGVGGMGSGHLHRMTKFREEGKVNIAAVCDVDELRLAAAVKAAGAGVTPYRDYRYICHRKDIDAVVIATPDHWHAVQTVHACETGKHVYVEKPASVTVEEGRAMVCAARNNHRAVQVGAQGRTGWGAYYTCRAIRNGIIGKVNKVTCWHYENPIGGWEANGPPPAELDWDMWLGPMRYRPYNQAYHPGNFRWFLDSGGGQIRDRGAHQFSTILWCMDADGPQSFTVEATGTSPPKGLYDCPVEMNAVFQFKDPEWTLIWAQPGDKLGKLEFGNVFWGENDQQLILEWEGAYKPAEPEAIHFEIPRGGYDPYRTNEYPTDFNMNHMADWFQAIRNPEYRPAVDIEIGHRTATLCNLANLSYMLGRKLDWDADAERVVGDELATGCSDVLNDIRTTSRQISEVHAMPFEETETVVNASAQATSDDEFSVPELLARMSHDDRTVAITAGRALWKVVRRAGRPNARDERTEVASQLKLSLGVDRPDDVSREVLWMLSEIGGDEAVDVVAVRLSDPSLREDARMVLERLPGGKALAALRSALDAADEDFQSNLVQSLRARGVHVEGIPCQKLLPVKGTDVREIP